MTTNSHAYPTTALAAPAAQPRRLHSPEPRQPDSFMELHHLAYHHQPSMGDYCDDDPHQSIPPPATTPMVLTTPDLAGLTCAAVPAEAMTESPNPGSAYAARVEAPSFLPYNFAIPDHLLAKDKAQAATTPSTGQAGLVPEPRAPSASPEARVELAAESGSVFKAPLSVLSAVAAAASLGPASTTRGKAKNAKRAPRPKRPPAAKAAATAPRRGKAPRPTTATASVKPATSSGGAPATAPQAIAESAQEVHNDDDNTKQGWEKIMQTVDTQDAKLQRNKWWWYLLAEKNRVTMQGGGMAGGAGTDLEKAQGGADGAGAQVSRDHTYDPMPLLAVASALRSPSSSPMPQSPGAGGVVESSPQFPPLHELSIYSASEDEAGDDDFRPDDQDHDQDHDDDDDGEDEDADWQPTRAKPAPASSRKRTTSNRRSARVVHPAGEEEEEEEAEEASAKAVAKSSAAKGVRVQGQPEAGSMAGCSSPPKRRRVGSMSGAGAGPAAGGQVVLAQGEGDAAAARKLPPRSRLKGLIEWMKSSGDFPAGGPHPPC